MRVAEQVGAAPESDIRTKFLSAAQSATALVLTSGWAFTKASVFCFITAIFGLAALHALQNSYGPPSVIGGFGQSLTMVVFWMPVNCDADESCHTAESQPRNYYSECAATKTFKSFIMCNIETDDVINRLSIMCNA